MCDCYAKLFTARLIAGSLLTAGQGEAVSVHDAAAAEDIVRAVLLQLAYTLRMDYVRNRRLRVTFDQVEGSSTALDGLRKAYLNV